MLDEAIVEESGDGRKADTILSWDSLEMEVATQVLRFVYCGAFDLGAIKTAKQLEACKGLNTNAIFSLLLSERTSSIYYNHLSVCFVSVSSSEGLNLEAEQLIVVTKQGLLRSCLCQTQNKKFSVGHNSL